MARQLSSSLAVSRGLTTWLHSGREQIVDLSLCLLNCDLPLFGTGRHTLGGDHFELGHANEGAMGHHTSPSH